MYSQNRPNIPRAGLPFRIDRGDGGDRDSSRSGASRAIDLIRTQR